MRSSRRRLGAFLLALTLLTVACGSSESTDTTTISSPATTTSTAPVTTTEATPTTTAGPFVIPDAPVYGGVVRIGIEADFTHPMEDMDGTRRQPSLNPLMPWPGSTELAKLFIPGAYRIDPTTGELLPWLVEEIPTLGNGGVVVDASGTVSITYTIRDEAVWEDGTSITAADMAFTHELLTSGALPPTGRSSPDEVHALLDTGSIETSGKTFTARLTSPDPSYERLFEFVLPAHAIDTASFAEDWNEVLWLSGGPFSFVSFERSTRPENLPSIVRFDRNPNYWEVDSETGNSLPYLDGIEVLAYTGGAIDDRDLVDDFFGGDVDALLGFLVPPWRIAAFGDPAERSFEASVASDTLFELITFQLGDTRFSVNEASLNEHLSYRKAVLSAVDRDAIAAATTGQPVSSILGLIGGRFDHDAWDQYSAPEAVDSLLADLGVTVGRDFAVEPPYAVYVASSGDTTRQIGTRVASQLEEAGWEVVTDFVGDFFGTTWPQGLTDLWAIRLFAGEGGLGSAVSFFSFLDPLGEDTLSDWSSVGDPAVRYSELVRRAEQELDPGVLLELLTEAERILADNAILYPLVRRQPTYRLYWPERIQGVVAHSAYGWDTWNAATWWSPQG